MINSTIIMVIGTHNSLTFAKPRKWWMWFLKPFAKCQKLTLEQQYDKGARVFDIRVRFDKEGNPVFAHGRYEMDFTINALFNFLNNRAEFIYLRIILETNKKNICDEFYFNNFYDSLKFHVSNKFIFGGYRKCDWEQLSAYILEVGAPDPNGIFNLIQCVGSMAKDARWYERFLPFTYAWRCNKKNKRKLFNNKDLIIFDFI